MKISRAYILFLVKFLGLYCALYYGTYAFIGLSVEGGRYIAWLKRVDYVSAYRNTILYCAEQLLQVMGYDAYRQGNYYLYIAGKNGVQLIYECLGIGMLSFWIAFVATDIGGTVKGKLKWMLAGICFITLLNITRISFLLLSAYKQWLNARAFDHHTVYNIILYCFVFGLLYYYKQRVSQEVV